MRTIWQSLIWKEWNEHKWKFASIVAILWSTAILVMCLADGDRFGMGGVLVTVCMVPIAVFLGLGAASGEQSRRTLPFLQSLPAPVWRIAVVKLVMGLLVLLASVALTLPLFYIWQRIVIWFSSGSSPIRSIPNDGFTGNWYLDIAVLCGTLATSFFIWSAATGVNRKDEVSAGAVAIATMVGWYMMLALLGYTFIHWTSTYRENPVPVWLKLLGLSLSPGGFIPAVEESRFYFRDDDAPLWMKGFIFILTTAMVAHTGLSVWYVRRFGRISNLEVRSPQVARRLSASNDWLAAPRTSPFAAVVWKQFREGAPIVLVGLAGVVGVSLFVYVLSSDSPVSGQLSHIGTVVISAFGWGIAIVVGVGVCLNDVGPQLNTFWRSRPIDPDLWFWCKFATGLVVLVVAMDLPYIVLANANRSSIPEGTGWLMSVPAAHVAIYAAAVATVSLVRQAVYGAILCIPLLYVGILLEWTALKIAGALGVASAPQRFVDMSEMQFAIGMLISFAISTVLAWLAARYDWGRKSRY